MRLSPVSKKLRRPVQFKNTAKILKRHRRWRHIQDVLSFLSLCFNRALLALFDTVNYAIENLRQLAVMLSSCYQNLVDSGILKNKRENIRLVSSGKSRKPVASLPSRHHRSTVVPKKTRQARLLSNLCSSEMPRRSSQKES